jgi:hypothetical protein
MPRRSSDADFRRIDNHEAPLQVFLSDRIEKARQSCFGVLDSGRPNPESNDASMGSGGVHPRVGKVLIEGDNDGEVALRPVEDGIVGSAIQSYVGNVPHLPMWLTFPHKLAD